MNRTTNEMTEGATLPQIFRFAVPLLGGNLLQQTYSLVDAAIVGKFLGIHALAAVGAGSSVIFLILGLLQRLLRRLRYSCSSEVRGKGLRQHARHGVDRV